MVNFKKQIADQLSNITNTKIEEEYIEKPKESEMGDYAFPCFRLAKELKKAPQIIAQEIKQKIEENNNKTNINNIEKTEVVGGYLNFYIKKEEIIKAVIQELNEKKENYGTTNIGQNQNIIIDYSSPNIAKPFHIGHLRSTVIGGALYKIYKFLGYNTIGINHLGDYGTQFGKLIEGYKKWGQEYNIENNPIDELTKIYVRINELCKQDEQVLNDCRNNFKKLEEGDEYCTKIWQKFRELSLQEFNKIYNILGSKFDSFNGEAFYSDKMEEIVQILEKAGKLKQSEGATIVDLEEKNMAPCIIKKSNESSTYATRDLAAILYRVRTYNFSKALYLTSYEQTLHFKQVFEVAKYLGIDEKYTNNLIHIPFGMVQLKNGKMSTREGNIIKLEELLNEAVKRAKEIIQEKNPNLLETEKEEIAKKVGIGAVIFNDLANSRIKDEIFDWDTILNFNGETGPYIQYTYVRTNSILKKAEYNIKENEQIEISELTDESSIQIFKILYEYTNTIKISAQKNEPSIISRYLINLASAFSTFYNNNKIMVEDEKTKQARIYLTYATNIVLKSGANLLGIQMPEKM